jgi:N-acetylneuraminic acid mutarotase
MVRLSGARCLAAVGAFLLLACGGDAIAPPPNGWVQQASLPGGPLTRAVSFVIHDKLYVGTGLRNTFTNSFYRYDPTGNRWTEVASLPAEARLGALAFAIGDYGYVGLGYNWTCTALCTNYFNDLWRYDPQSDAWARVADFPGTTRGYGSSFIIGENSYVMEGSPLWEYNPAGNRWTPKADYPGACAARGAGFSLAGRGYAGFGYTDGACKDVWSYDPSADAWTAIAPFPGPARYDALGFSVGDVAFIAGGAMEAPTYLRDVWTYHPATDTWAQMQTTLPGIGRSQMIAGIVAGRIFLGLGTNDEMAGPDASFDDLWEYTPDE